MLLGVPCCVVLNLLYDHMVAGDRLPADQCQQTCAASPLVHLFVNQTRLMLDPGRALAQGGVSVAPGLAPGDGPRLLFEVDAARADFASLCVFAFFGRSVAPRAEEPDSPWWLTYVDGRVALRESAGEFNKGVYTFLVLASVVLLIFFIAVQVKRDESEALRAQAEAQKMEQERREHEALKEQWQRMQKTQNQLGQMHFRLPNMRAGVD